MREKDCNVIKLKYPVGTKIASLALFIFFNIAFLWGYIATISKYGILSFFLLLALLIFVWTLMLVCDAFRQYFFDDDKIWYKSIIAPSQSLRIDSIHYYKIKRTNPFLSIQQGTILNIYNIDRSIRFGINTAMENYELLYVVVKSRIDKNDNTIEPNSFH